MICAIYARKSTDQTGVGEEDRSVTRQIAHAKDYAARKGWTVDDRHVYTDDGISGAEFVKRPGFLRLMNALKPTPPFHILVMSEESRLGRESIETAWSLKQIIDAGVRVFFYLEDKERTLDTPMDKVMLSLTNFASEMERDKARQRVYDAMLRKAKAGLVTGGHVYGYRNQEVLSDTVGPDGRRTRQHVVRVIDEDQATVVRRIFTMCVEGKGLTKIAKTLNAEGIASPRTKRGWAPTAIREMLYRELYHGVLTWNRTQRVMKGGTAYTRVRPETAWLRIPVPHLQIVDDVLWQAAQERLARTRAVYARSQEKGRFMGRPTRLDIESPYLLSGMLSCQVCGGSLIAITRTHGAQRHHYYICSYHHNRGKRICPNALAVPQASLDQAVLSALMGFLDERILALAVDKALFTLRQSQPQQQQRRADLEHELAMNSERRHHLTEAIARGDVPDSLLTKLRAEEAHKRHIEAELAQLANLNMVGSLEAAQVVESLKTRLSDLQALLTRQVPQARQALRKVLVNRLEVTPIEGPEARGVRFSGSGHYGRLLAGTSGPAGMVAVEGIEPPTRGL